MLKRIAVVSDNEEWVARIKEAAGDRDVEAIAVNPGQGLPAATAAVAIGAERLAEATGLLLEQVARYEELLDLVGFAIDTREQFIPGECRRLKEHATRFARALGLDSEARSKFERGALVHDIGKLKIPNEILLKKTVLTYDEWVLLQSHTQLGAELVRGIESLKDTEEIVRWHHECYDGTGYPDALEGERIPYLARAMKLIDAYCAMTSPRHYRKGHSTHEQALEYLKSEKGKHFDPELTSVFIDAGVGRPTSPTTS